MGFAAAMERVSGFQAMLLTVSNLTVVPVPLGHM
jgi:hypothetical protein